MGRHKCTSQGACGSDSDPECIFVSLETCLRSLAAEFCDSTARIGSSLWTHRRMEASGRTDG